MHKPINLKKWLRDDQGVTSIEYALLGSLIAIVILASVIALGSSVKSLRNDRCSHAVMPRSTEQQQPLQNPTPSN